MKLQAIALKPVKKGPMQPVESGLITQVGLDGNYYGLLRNIIQSRRQVTLISLEQWHDAMDELGADLPWFWRRANLCVVGHRFGPEDVGRSIGIGTTARLEITGETDPCRRMDEVRPGLWAALTPSWRGGVTCRVLSPGPIQVGDKIYLH